MSGSRWQPVGVSVVSLMVGYGVSRTSGKEWISQRKIVSKGSVVVSKEPVGTDYYGLYVSHLVLSEGCNPGPPEEERNVDTNISPYNTQSLSSLSWITSNSSYNTLVNFASCSATACASSSCSLVSMSIKKLSVTIVDLLGMPDIRLRFDIIAEYVAA